MFFIKLDHFDVFVLRKDVLEVPVFQEISNYAPPLAFFHTFESPRSYELGAFTNSAYSQSSRKRTPSGRDKNVRNWSWPLTRMVLVSGH